jgi:CRISPR/Cas system-associated exonuclease Cas4 (RecB family)
MNPRPQTATTNYDNTWNKVTVDSKIKSNQTTQQLNEFTTKPPKVDKKEFPALPLDKPNKKQDAGVGAQAEVSIEVKKKNKKKKNKGEQLDLFKLKEVDYKKLF